MISINRLALLFRRSRQKLEVHDRAAILTWRECVWPVERDDEGGRAAAMRSALRLPQTGESVHVTLVPLLHCGTTAFILFANIVNRGRFCHSYYSLVQVALHTRRLCDALLNATFRFAIRVR